MTSELPNPDSSNARSNQRPLCDYGMIGDMRGAALVADDAAMEWLCLQRFDADPVFLGLLDAGQGGACTVTLRGGTRKGARRYRDGTNILETTLDGVSGSVTVTDFMPVRRVVDPGDVGADSEAPGQVVRIVRCMVGTATVDVGIAPAFDWGRRTTMPALLGRCVSYPGEDLHLASSHPFAQAGGGVTTGGILREGETLTLVMAHTGPLDAAAIEEAQGQLAETEDYWTGWLGGSRHAGPNADLVARSSLCLKLLTYAPTGAMVAAATTGLPESPGGVRNWDYRFVWTRDASFSVSALLNLDQRREAAEFLRFLHRACDKGEVVRVMYGVDGHVPDEQSLGHLAGWRGSTPVLVGNEANGQKQHEIYGELLAALNLYVSRYGTDGLCLSLREDLPRFVQRLAEAALANWRIPDQGIWELRGEPRHLLHTKAMCWVALDRAIKLAPRIGLDTSAHWETERDAIRAECLERGWNDRVGALTMEYGSDVLDMSTLRLSLMDMLPADDPRMTATLEASARELGTGDLYWRYRFDDGLPGEEGAFAACSFWVVGLHTLRGELAQARSLLERLLSRATDLGLYAEEFDVGTGEQIGNFPQGFTHMAVIHEAMRLHEAETKAGTAS